MLEIKKVSKTYAHTKALHQIDLTLKEGIYALLGPNGSGKSTLMNILCDQIKMDEGDVLWEHTSIHKLKSRYFDILGYAPQQQGLYDEFSGRRFLSYMALLKNIPKKAIPSEVERVAKLVNMQTQLSKKCRAYSGGMKQRILVAQALLGHPKLLLFDEPTAGLDPMERVSLRNVFRSLASDHILLIATHVVSDVETIANDIIILKSGEIIAQGTLSSLIQNCPNAKSLEDVYLWFQEEKDS